jgi:acyl carrier protein
MGVDELSLVEIMLEAEDEFYLELPDEEVERFSNIRDATEYIARSFYSAY